MTAAGPDPLCAALFGPAANPALAGLLCAAVIALLLGLLALGFEPLRGWLGWARGSSPSPWYEVDVAGAWRLSRAIYRVAPEFPASLTAIEPCVSSSSAGTTWSAP